MAKQRNTTKMAQLAVLCAAGSSINDAANDLKVNPRTARNWANTSEYKTMFAEHQGATIGAAVGLLSTHAVTAAKRLIKLVLSGKTEAIQLAASRAVLEKLIDVSSHASVLKEIADLRGQHAELEAFIHARRSEST